MKNYIFIVLFVFTCSIIIQGQSKETSKFLKMIEKEQLEKAQAYFDKVSPNLETKLVRDMRNYLSSAYEEKVEDMVKNGQLDEAKTYLDNVAKEMTKHHRPDAYTTVGKAYLKKNQVAKALTCVDESETKYFINDVASRYAYKNTQPYDIDIAIKLYKKTNNREELSYLYFYEKNDVKNALKYCMKYCEEQGLKLFKDGRVEDAAMYYKAKGGDSLKVKLLNYYYDKKMYKEAYNINKKGKKSTKTLTNLYTSSHGWTVYEMLKKKVSVKNTLAFLSEIEIEESVSMKVVIQALIRSASFDELEKLIIGLDSKQQKEYWKFSMQHLKDNTPEHSICKASIAKKIGAEEYIVTNALHNYLWETISRDYNRKWNKKPIDRALFVEFRNKVEGNVNKTGHKFCKFMIDIVLVRSGHKVENLANGNQNKFSDAKKVFDFASELAIWCAKK